MRVADIRDVACVSALACSALVSGCASVVDGASQPVYVETTPETGANCTLSNNRGTWSIVTPGSVTVKKSVSTLKAVCTKTGWQESMTYAAPRQSATAILGAVLLLGPVETLVDGATGAGNDYPKSLIVHMLPLTMVSVENSDAKSATTPNNEP